MLRYASAEALYRFKWEFRALADLVHPNLVTLYELLAEGDRCFFTMELVRGVSFVDYVRWRPAFDSTVATDQLTSLRTAPDTPVEEFDAETRTWDSGEPRTGTNQRPRSSSPDALDADRLRAALAQLAHGLCALHDAGKLHRDVKPSNVLVTHEGRVVLLDFGLVTELGLERGHDQIDARIVGTPAYMSPEQSAGRTISESTDWYSAGVMLYEALTGRRPFDGDFVAMLTEKQQRESPAPADIVPGIPDDLDELCRALLRSDPAARPAGSDVLARIGGPISPRAPTTDVHSQPFVGRQRHLAALEDAFAATKPGRTVTVYVHGASGMGKSALVRRFLQQLTRSEPDAVVLRGRCYEQESVPYKALDPLVDDLSQYLQRLPPAQAEALLPRDAVALSRLFPVLLRVEALAG